MELFGIGPMELIFILIIILLVIGPNDIQKFARNFGKFLNRMYKSPGYNMVRQASDELRNLPARLAREAQLDELKNMDELQQIKTDLQEASSSLKRTDKPFDAWINDLTTPATPPAPPAAPPNGTADKQERDA